jgi:hypothetical protein
MDYKKSELRNGENNLLKRVQRQLDRENNKPTNTEEFVPLMKKSSLSLFPSLNKAEVISEPTIELKQKKTKLSLFERRGCR